MRGTIRKGGVLGSVLGEPEGAKKYDIRVEAFIAQPDTSRLYQLAEGVVATNSRFQSLAP